MKRLVVALLAFGLSYYAMAQKVGVRMESGIFRNAFIGSGASEFRGSVNWDIALQGILHSEQATYGIGIGYKSLNYRFIVDLDELRLLDDNDPLLSGISETKYRNNTFIQVPLLAYIKTSHEQLSLPIRTTFYIKDQAEMIYKTFFMSIGSGLSITPFSLSDRFQLSIEPNFELLAAPVDEPFSDISQMWFSYGLRVGLSYQ